MRKILALFLAFGLAAFAAQKSDWEKDELRGKVKVLTSVHKDYDAKGNVTSETTQKTTFNNQGFKLKFELFVDGKKRSEQNYEYDAQNRLVRSDDDGQKFSYIYAQSGDLTLQTRSGGAEMIFTYDKNGVLLSEKSIGAHKYSVDTQYIYNERGDLVEIRDNVRPKNGIKYSYEYDGDVKLAQNGRMRGRKWRNEYDKNGFETRNVFESELGTQVNLRLESKFDAAGNVTEVKFYDEKSGKLTREIQNSYEYY